MSRFLHPVEFVKVQGVRPDRWSSSDSSSYTRWLARSHYENFNVVSFLLPRSLHQDFYNVYGFCRWADDLGDEFGDANESLNLLDSWREQLAEMYRGDARHPVFVALSETVAKHDIPEQPFADLIRAFVQDQTVTRYESYDQLLDYCRYSANPVGRLVLHLCGYRDAKRVGLSDAVCTALQLTNFWQDVVRDWDKGRIYLPGEVMEKHGYSVAALEADIGTGRASERCRGLLRELVERAEALFAQGQPLAGMVNRRLAIDLDLFSRGGLEVLSLIRRQDYDVIGERPRLRKWNRVRLMFEAVGRRLFTASRGGDEAGHVFP